MWAERDDPDRALALTNLSRVIEYLEGKSAEL